MSAKKEYRPFPAQSEEDELAAELLRFISIKPSAESYAPAALLIALMRFVGPFDYANFLKKSLGE